MIEKIKEIDRLIFEYKDISNRKQKEDLKKYLEFQINLLNFDLEV